MNAAFPTPTKQRTPTSLVQIAHTHSVTKNVCSVILSTQFNSATVTGISPKEEKITVIFSTVSIGFAPGKVTDDSK